jgi:hypothetical protein
MHFYGTWNHFEAFGSFFKRGTDSLFSGKEGGAHFLTAEFLKLVVRTPGDVCLTAADKYLPHFRCPPGIHSK